MGISRDRVRAASRAVFRLVFLACVVCPIADLPGLSRAGVEAQETTPDVTAGGDSSEGQGAGDARPGAPRRFTRTSAGSSSRPMISTRILLYSGL